MTYERTLIRIEDYFDRTATEVWARLTSDAPVSRVRATVRAGRDAMRERLIEALPAARDGARVLDAGCGTGAATAVLAAAGAEVVAADISPALVEIAEARLPDALAPRVRWHVGDMFDPALGRFDAVIAQDSLIYYRAPDLVAALGRLASRCAGPIAFTVAPRTALLMAMWRAGKLFPRSDRAPVMEPVAPARLAAALSHTTGRAVADLGRVHSGFYISHALALAPAGDAP